MKPARYRQSALDVAQIEAGIARMKASHDVSKSTELTRQDDRLSLRNPSYNAGLKDSIDYDTIPDRSPHTHRVKADMYHEHKNGSVSRSMICYGSGISGTRIERKIVDSHSNYLQDLRASCQSSSLDYSCILPPFRPSRGISVSWHRKEPAAQPAAPGPGRYNVRPKSRASEGAVFGKERKEILDPLYKKDDRGFYIDIFAEEHDRAKFRGYSFNKQRRNVEVPAGESMATPGPGYYSYKSDALSEKQPAVIISLSGAYDDARNTSTVQAGASSAEGRLEQWKGNNFQKFSGAERFSQRGWKYFRIIRRSQDTDRKIVDKNKAAIHDATFTNKIKRILQSNRELSDKIHRTQEIRDSMTFALRYAVVELLEEHIQKILAKKEEVKRRKVENRDKAEKNILRLAKYWVLCGSALFWGHILADKYNRRHFVRDRTLKLLKIFFVCFMAVGKFVLLMKRAKARVSLNRMSTIVQVMIATWRVKRRIREKEKAMRFIKSYETQPAVLALTKFVLSKLTILRHWMMRIITKKQLMMAISNLQWALLENAVVHIRKMEGLSAAKRLAIAERFIKEHAPTDIVPVPVRVFYIKQKLKVRLLCVMG